jgi:hypothetical protein
MITFATWEDLPCVYTETVAWLKSARGRLPFDRTDAFVNA